MTSSCPTIFKEVVPLCAKPPMSLLLRAIVIPPLGPRVISHWPKLITDLPFNILCHWRATANHICPPHSPKPPPPPPSPSPNGRHSLLAAVTARLNHCAFRPLFGRWWTSSRAAHPSVRQVHLSAPLKNRCCMKCNLVLLPRPCPTGCVRGVWLNPLYRKSILSSLGPSVYHSASSS